MDIHRYRHVSALPEGVFAFLAQDDALNNVPYGILKLMQQNPAAFQDYQIFLVTGGGKILLYAHHTPPFAPYLSLGEPRAAAALARYFQKAGDVLPGLLGALEVTEPFLDQWPELRGRWRHVERQGFYRLDAVNMPPLTGAAFERAKPQDAPLYYAWLRAFCSELNDYFPGEEKMRQQQDERIKAGELYCLSVDGRPRSMAVAGRRTIQGRCVSYVYTPPEERGKGYAAELVARVSQKILDEGALYCCLFTQLDNQVSNRIYQRMGYQFLAEFRKYG